MKKLLVTILLVVVSLSGVLAGQQYVIKYSHVSPPDPFEQCSGAYAAVFKNEVERFSGGRIKVEIYPAAQLGDQRASIEMLSQGLIQMTDVALGVFSSLMYPPLEIVDMPYLFTLY